MVKLMIQYLNGILMTLKLIYQIKATQGITGLIYWIAHIKWMVWHLDVGLSFPKSVGSLIGGSAHPITSRQVVHAGDEETLRISMLDVNQFGL